MAKFKQNCTKHKASIEIRSIYFQLPDEADSKTETLLFNYKRGSLKVGSFHRFVNQYEQHDYGSLGGECETITKFTLKILKKNLTTTSYANAGKLFCVTSFTWGRRNLLQNFTCKLVNVKFEIKDLSKILRIIQTASIKCRNTVMLDIIRTNQ